MTNNDLKKHLSTLDKNELIKLLLELNKQKINKLYFEEKFLTLNEDGIELMIEGLYSKYEQRGYVSRSNADKMYQDVLALIDKIETETYGVNQFKLWVKLIDELSNLDAVDDSNGGLVYTIESILNHINDMVNEHEDSFSKQEVSEMIDYAFKHLIKDNSYSITDWRNAVWLKLALLIKDESNYQRLNNYLEVIIEKSKHKKYTYDLEMLYQIRYVALSGFDQRKADLMIEEHLEFEMFQILKLDQLFEAHAYDKCKVFIYKILENQPNRQFSVVLYQYLERIGFYQNDLELMKDALKQLLYLGEVDYYEAYKALFTKPVFEEEINHFLQGSGSLYGPNIRNHVVTKEDLQSVMIEDIKKDFRYINLYYHHLKPESFRVLEPVLIQFIKEEAARSYKRSHYRFVCKLIKQFSKDLSEKQYELIDYLKSKYRRKDAFIDELNKLSKSL